MLLFIASCSGNEKDIDIAQSGISINALRLEVDLFKKPSDNLEYGIYQQLQNKYGRFFELFLENIIAVGRAKDSSTLYYLNHFLNDVQVREIARATLEAYPDVDELNNQLTDAFRRYEALFPGKVIPEFYTFLSAFSYTIVVDDSLMGIGLDMYLGRECEYYRLLAIPFYKTRKMSREYIVTDCMMSWLMTEFELQGQDLLSNMIYQGKIIYALDILLPDHQDSLKTGFSGPQLGWLEKNEKDIWFHLTDNEALFQNDPKLVQKYLGEGPFTPGFPEGSPGAAAKWTGYRIVKKYMAEGDELDLQSLFNEKDSQKILKKSKYKGT